MFYYLREKIQHIKEKLFHLLYPPYCYACDKILVCSEKKFCLHCLASLPLFENDNYARERMLQKWYGFLPQIWTYGLFLFRKKGITQKVLHILKYSDPTLAYEMGHLMEWYVNKIKHPQWDLIIPIPMFHLKEKKRGYNQTVWLAKGFGDAIKTPVKHLIFRKKEGSIQSLKNRRERLQKLYGIFSIVKNAKIKNKKILLIDDIVTTGATLQVNATLLLQEGASSVSFLTWGVNI